MNKNIEEFKISLGDDIKITLCKMYIKAQTDSRYRILYTTFNSFKIEITHNTTLQGLSNIYNKYCKHMTEVRTR